MLSMTTEKKLRISNNPNGLAWSRDENKFGQKLMEKMGWTKGKGLGANEDGMTDHVKVSLKSDKKGVGCTQAHTSKWLDLQDDYEAILATMNASNSSSGNNCQSQDDDDKKEFIPLVQKSQNTKSRLHYSRFAKGKDLSTKTEKDLDCIFGTRAKREEKITVKKCEETATGESSQKAEFGVLTTTSATNVQDYFTQKMEAIKLGKKITKKSEESCTSECSQKTEFGVTTTTSTTSVNDYFALKMASLRRAKSDTHLTKMCHEDEEVVHARFYDDTGLPTIVHIEENIVLEKVSDKKSKKKKRKERQDSSEVKLAIDGSSEICETLQMEESKETFPKNKESCTEINETQENPCEQHFSSHKTKKRKKKRDTDEVQVNCDIESTVCVKPIMEKRNPETEIMSTNDSMNSISSKKRKRNKEVEDKQDAPCETESNECIRVKKRK